jgi:hypothetical protein
MYAMQPSLDQAIFLHFCQSGEILAAYRKKGFFNILTAAQYPHLVKALREAFGRLWSWQRQVQGRRISKEIVDIETFVHDQGHYTALDSGSSDGPTRKADLDILNIAG